MRQILRERMREFKNMLDGHVAGGEENANATPEGFGGRNPDPGPNPGPQPGPRPNVVPLADSSLRARRSAATTTPPDSNGKKTRGSRSTTTRLSGLPMFGDRFPA
jgi:hypothetical protein